MEDASDSGDNTVLYSRMAHSNAEPVGGVKTRVKPEGLSKFYEESYPFPLALLKPKPSADPDLAESVPFSGDGRKQTRKPRSEAFGHGHLLMTERIMEEKMERPQMLLSELYGITQRSKHASVFGARKFRLLQKPRPNEAEVGTDTRVRRTVGSARPRGDTHMEKAEDSDDEESVTGEERVEMGELEQHRFRGSILEPRPSLERYEERGSFLSKNLSKRESKSRTVKNTLLYHHSPNDDWDNGSPTRNKNNLLSDKNEISTPKMNVDWSEDYGDASEADSNFDAISRSRQHGLQPPIPSHQKNRGYYNNGLKEEAHVKSPVGRTRYSFAEGQKPMKSNNQAPRTDMNQKMLEKCRVFPVDWEYLQNRYRPNAKPDLGDLGRAVTFTMTPHSIKALTSLFSFALNNQRAENGTSKDPASSIIEHLNDEVADNFRQPSLYTIEDILITIRTLVESPINPNAMCDQALMRLIVSALKIQVENTILVWLGAYILEKMLFHSKFIVEPRVEAIIILLKAIEMHKDHDVHLICIRSLFQNVGDETIRNGLGSVAVFEPLLKTLGNFTIEQKANQEAFVLLQRLSSGDQPEKELVKAGLVAATLKFFLEQGLQIAIYPQAYGALWNFTFSDSVRKLFADEHKHLLVGLTKLSKEQKPIYESTVSKYLAIIWNLADQVAAKDKFMADDVPLRVINLMKESPDHPGIQQNGCGLLRSLAHNDPSRIKLMQMDAASVILQAMDIHAGNQEILYQAFAVLKKLSCNDVNEGNLIRMDAGKKILKAMEAHMGNSSIQERACGVLWNLAVNDDHKVRLVDIGCAKAMIEAMKRHVKNTGVQYQTCRTLKRLARDPHNEEALMRIGAAETVLAAMKNHGDSANIQEKACGVLWNLSDRDPHKTILVQLGAPELILFAMQKHIVNEHVQYEACGALKRLAVDDAIEVELMRLNAASYVLEAMKMHPMNSDVQSQACGVLWNLAFNGQKRLMELEAAKRIFVAMKNHRRNHSVQEKACGTLWKLAEVEANNPNLINDGVISNVLEAMDHNIPHAGIQYQACGTLWNLAVKEANRETLLHNQVEDRVLKAMDIHRSRADIVHSACGVIYNLAQKEINLPKVLIAPMAMNFVPDLALKLDQLKTITGTKVDTDSRFILFSNRHVLAAKGSIVELVKSMRIHANNVDVVYQSLAALNFLAAEAKNLIFFVREMAIVNDIVFAMQTHEEDVGIQENGCLFLSRMMEFSSIYHSQPELLKGVSLNPGPISILIPHSLVRKGITLVVWAMRRFGTRPNVQLRGLMFLYLAYQELVTLRNRTQEIFKQSQQSPFENGPLEYNGEEDEWEINSLISLEKKKSELNTVIRNPLDLDDDSARTLAQRIEYAMHAHPTDAKIQMLAQRCLIVVFTSAMAEYPVPLCSSMKKAILYNQSSFIKRLMINIRSSKRESERLEAMKCIRLFLDSESAREAAELLVQQEYLDFFEEYLRTAQVANPDIVVVGVTTIATMLRSLDQDPEFQKNVSKMFWIALHAALPTSETDHLTFSPNPLRAVWYLWQTPGMEGALAIDLSRRSMTLQKLMFSLHYKAFASQPDLLVETVNELIIFVQRLKNLQLKVYRPAIVSLAISVESVIWDFYKLLTIKDTDQASCTFILTSICSLIEALADYDPDIASQLYHAKLLRSTLDNLRILKGKTRSAGLLDLARAAEVTFQCLKVGVADKISL